MPRFSIITPVFETPAPVLKAMLESVRAQSFADWQHCLVDDCSKSPDVAEILDVAAGDPRFVVIHREQNGGISAASNDGLAAADGEFIVLLDHDDELHPDALAQIDEAIAARPDADYIYSDEDKIDEAGRHSAPFFKPNWSPDRLRTQMYTCHVSAMRRELVEEVGGFDPGFDGSQDWDLVLRVTERARDVVHIPSVLYHWRTLESSTAGGGEEAKPWAFEAGTRAIQAHCDRTGFEAVAERDEQLPGVYHLRPALKQRPAVSIVIPTRGQRREVRFEDTVLVTHCVRSIVEKSSYDNYEIVCVADVGMEPGVREELQAIAPGKVSFVDYDRPFNFSAKINAGVLASSGEQLLMLNDDIEVVNPDWLERMVMYARQDRVGAVGGRLLWQDGRLQHVGVEFQHGLPGHPYRGFAGDFNGYSNSVRVAGNPLAVTAACMMTPRTVFDEVGGFTTTLPSNYNDVDYCLKLHQRGHRCVYDPDTVLYHFESSSRSSEVEDWEKEEFLARWESVTAVDPMASPHLRNGRPRLTGELLWATRRDLMSHVRRRIRARLRASRQARGERA